MTSLVKIQTKTENIKIKFVTVLNDATNISNV